MIFVPLGTQNFQLNRLLIILDDYIDKNLLDKKEVFAQIGSSTYKPKHFEYIDFLEKKDFEGKIQEADLILTHGGVGVILSAMSHGKSIVVFPRLAKFKEHVDNHQLEIAHAFAKKDFVLCCNENDSLIDLISKSKSFSFKKYHSQNENINEIISNYIKNN